MSSRYWIAAIAFGLIAGLGNAQDKPAPEGEPGQQESTANGQDQGTEEQSAAIDPTPALKSIESAIRDLKAEIDQVEQKRQRENDRRDLSAKESMAKWAFWMFVATTATVILTAIALWGILRTLHHTKRAANFSGDMVEQAKESTAAAMRAVDVTRDIGDVQIRAYIHPIGVEIVETESDGFKIDLAIRNYGASPARNARVNIRISSQPPNANHWQSLNDAECRRVGDLGPTQEFGAKVPLESPAFERVLHDRMFYMARVVYETMGEERVTLISYIIEPSNPCVARRLVVGEGNSST